MTLQQEGLMLHTAFFLPVCGLGDFRCEFGGKWKDCLVYEHLGLSLGSDPSFPAASWLEIVHKFKSL